MQFFKALITISILLNGAAASVERTKLKTYLAGYCDGGNDCCSICYFLDECDYICKKGEGDCDYDRDCLGSMKCGMDNCVGPHFDPTDDCCEPGCTGEDDCCSATNQCTEGEGDCDSDDQCLGDLVCGTDNCVGDSFDSTDDCCQPEPVTSPTTSATTSTTTEATSATLPVCAEFDRVDHLEVASCESIKVKNKGRSCNNMFDKSLSQNVKSGHCFLSQSSRRGWVEVSFAKTSTIAQVTILAKGSGTELPGAKVEVCQGDKCTFFKKIGKFDKKFCTHVRGPKLRGNKIRVSIKGSALAICEMRVYSS